jgi:hypothetical protein
MNYSREELLADRVRHAQVFAEALTRLLEEMRELVEDEKEKA